MPGPLGQILDRMNAARRERGLPPRRLRRPPIKAMPERFEREYHAAIRPIAQQAISLVEQRVLPRLGEFNRRHVPRLDDQRTDVDVPDEIDDIFAQIQGDLDLIRDAERVAQGTATAVNARNAQNVREQLEAVFGQRLLISDNPMRETIRGFVQENVELIRTIPQGHLSRVRNAVIRGLNAGQTIEQIGSEIERITRATETQALTIARDQVQKLDGTLTRLRQTELGIRRYIWRTVGDDRVRPKHADRDGRSFSWSSPPSDGHPGQPINCRCVALPDIQSASASR